MSDKITLDVCIGLDVPAYTTMEIEVDKSLLGDKNALIGEIAKIAHSSFEDGQTLIEPEWDESAAYRIVFAQRDVADKSAIILEDTSIPGYPRYSEAGKLLSSFAKDGNPETLVGALRLLDVTEDQARAVLDRMAPKPRVVITVQGGTVEVMSSHPLTALVVDYDCEGFGPDEGVMMVPQIPPCPDEPALVREERIEPSPQSVIDRYFSVLEDKQ